MRRLILLSLLAAACDQGATAAPAPAERGPLVIAPTPVPKFEAYVVRDDADFVEKAIQVLDGLGAVFEDGSKDCERVATRVEQFSAENVTRFSVLTAYGKAHPDAERLLESQHKAKVEKLIQSMMPTLSACSSNQRLMSAFQKLADTGNTQAIQQRPR